VADIESRYKKANGSILIEIKLSSLLQLFNSFDPAPFHEKELDSAAEHYIVGTVDDFPKKTRFRIVIYLPPDLVGTVAAQKIRPAIQNHFEYKTLVAERAFRSRLKYGRFTLLLGLSFLFFSLFVGESVLNFSNSFASQLAAHALLIAGWAAMWEPVTVLLYELYPLVQKKKTYQKISTMEIDILPYPADTMFTFPGKGTGDGGLTGAGGYAGAVP